MHSQRRFNNLKYGNVPQGGYDSKLEAQYGQELELRQKAGDIKGFDRQYKCEITSPHTGKRITSYKLDFRVHENDGSFTLVEVKGMETYSYQLKRNMLEELWLPEHPDHVFEVIKASHFGRGYR